MTLRQISLFIVLSLLFCAPARAQNDYWSVSAGVNRQIPQRSQWATSPPNNPDPAPNVSDDGSMSPDQWSQPSSSASVENSTQSSHPGFTPTPSVPDLGAKTRFQMTGNSRVLNPPESFERFDSESSREIEDMFQTAGLSRYPLNQGKAQGKELQSVVNSRPEQPPVTTQNWLGSECENCPGHSDYPLHGGQAVSNFRPDLGQRSELPTIRGSDALEPGQQFEFDLSGESPSLREVFATGRYFGSVSGMYLKGALQGSTAISIQQPGLAEGVAFDFDYEIAPHFRFGFESSFGPGFELEFLQYDETSNVASFTSDGIATGTTSSWESSPGGRSRLTAGNFGEQLDVTHAVDFEVVGVSFFKEIKFKVSRLNGTFGYQYTSISQSTDATLSDGGSELGRMFSRSDFNAWGPRFSIEYYRPIGHTKLEIFTMVGGAAMFGHRDQWISNTATGVSERFGADEFVTTVNFTTGVQYKKMVAENRAFYARFGLNYQSWIGGGTATDPQGDFGLHGYSFGIGFNR